MRRNFISRNIERVVLVIGGFILSVIIQSLFESAITWNTSLISFLFVLFVIVAVYYLEENHKSVSILSESMGTTVRFVGQASMEKPEVKFRDAYYQDLSRIVNSAENELLVLTAFIADRDSVHPSRAKYLDVIRRMVLRNCKKGFRYVRINQIYGVENSVSPLYDSLDKESIIHCRQMLEMASREEGNHDLNITIMKVKAHSLTSFMIIDRKYMTISVIGTDESGKVYPLGSLLVEDKAGKVIGQFVKYFDDAIKLAETSDISEFAEI